MRALDPESSASASSATSAFGDAQKARQLRSRFAQGLSTYQPETTSAPTGVGWEGENAYASPERHWALTNSSPSANVTTHYSSRRGPHCGLAERPFLNIRETYHRKELDYPEFSSLTSSKRWSNCSLCDTTSRLSHGPVPKSSDLTWIAADDNAFTYESCRGQK